MGRHAQTGLVAIASCQEYVDGVIKKHELTRPDKEDDRVKHIEYLNAQTGNVFLAYRAVKQMDELAARVTVVAPDIDFTARTVSGIPPGPWRIWQRFRPSNPFSPRFQIYTSQTVIIARRPPRAFLPRAQRFR